MCLDAVEREVVARAAETRNLSFSDVFASSTTTHRSQNRLFWFWLKPTVLSALWHFRPLSFSRFALLALPPPPTPGDPPTPFLLASTLHPLCLLTFAARWHSHPNFLLDQGTMCHATSSCANDLNLPPVLHWHPREDWRRLCVGRGSRSKNSEF